MQAFSKVLEAVLDDSVLKGMKRQDADTSSGFEVLCKHIHELPESFQFLVYSDSQRHEHPCGGMTPGLPFGSWDSVGNDIRQLKTGTDSCFLPGDSYPSGNLLGPAFFSICFEEMGEFFFIQRSSPMRLRAYLIEYPCACRGVLARLKLNPLPLDSNW